MRDKMEIDKHTHWWRRKDDEKRLLGFQIVHVRFPEIDDSVVGVLYHGDLASKAAARVTSFLAS